MPVDTCSNVVGGTTRLECRVLGDPPPDIRWFKDGRDITHNRRFSFSSSADGDVSILIENISPRDEGYYRCRAENSEGFASTSAYLVVRGFRQHPDDVREQVYTMQVEDVLSSKGTSSTVSPIHIRKDADEAGQRRTFEQIVDEEKGGGRDGRLKINGKETSTKSLHTRHELTFAQSSTARELSGSRQVVKMEEKEERTEVKVTTLDSQPREGSRQSSALTQSLSTKEKVSFPLGDGSSSDAQTSRTSTLSSSMATTSQVTSVLGDVATDGAQTSRDSQIEIVITEDESFWSRTSRTSRSVTTRPEVNRSSPVSQQTEVDQSLSRSQHTEVDQSLSRRQQTEVDQSLSRSQHTEVDQSLSRRQQTEVDQSLSRSQHTEVDQSLSRRQQTELDQSLSRSQHTELDQSLSRLEQAEVLRKGKVVTEVVSEESVTMPTNISKQFLGYESRTEVIGREAADGEIQTREKSIAVSEMTDTDTGNTLHSSGLHTEQRESKQRETAPSAVKTDDHVTAMSNEGQLAEVTHSDIFRRASAIETTTDTTSSFETQETKVKQSSEGAAPSGTLTTPATAKSERSDVGEQARSERSDVGEQARPERSDVGEAAEMKGAEHIPVACRLQLKVEREWEEWGDQEMTGEPPGSLLHDSGFADTSLMEVSQSRAFSLTDAAVLLPEGIQAVSEVDTWEKETSRDIADMPSVSKQAPVVLGTLPAMEATEASGDERPTDVLPVTVKTWRRRRWQAEDEESVDRETRLLEQHRHLDDTEARQGSALAQPDNLPSHPEFGAWDEAKETSELERISTRMATIESEETKEKEVTGLVPMRPQQMAVEEESGWSEGGWVSQVTRNETVTMEGERKVVEAKPSGDLSAPTSKGGANTSGSETQTAEPGEQPGVDEDIEFSAVDSTTETETETETETVVVDLESSVDPVTVDRRRARASDEVSSPAGSRAGDSMPSGDAFEMEEKEGQRSETGEVDATHASFASVSGAGRSREQDSTDSVVAEASSLPRHRRTSVESEEEKMRSSQENPQPPRDTEDDEATSRACATDEVKATKRAAPRVLSAPEDVKVNQGETIRLVSQVIGNPLPEVKWFKEGDTVKPGDRVTLQVADNLFTLEIKEATEGDGGTYTLTAHNSEGTIFSDVLVTVTIPPSMGLSGEELRVMASLAVPDIVAQSGEVTVRELGTLTLVCTVRGNPSPSVEWSKDGETLQADNRHRIYDSQGQYYLEIPRVALEDAGDYTCTASNSEGSMSCFIAVFIERSVREVTVEVSEEAVAMEPVNQLESSSDVSGSSVESAITRHLKLVAAAAAFSLAAFGLNKIVESLPKG